MKKLLLAGLLSISSLLSADLIKLDIYDVADLGDDRYVLSKQFDVSDLKPGQDRSWSMTLKQWPVGNADGAYQMTVDFKVINVGDGDYTVKLNKSLSKDGVSLARLKPSVMTVTPTTKAVGSTDAQWIDSELVVRQGNTVRLIPSPL